MAALNNRLYWMAISILFLTQFILSFAITESGTFVIAIIFNGIIPNIDEHSYLDCQWFAYLFYYTRMVLPILHLLPVIIWFYTNVLLGFNRFAQNEIVLAICPILSSLFCPYISLSSAFDNQYIDRLSKRSIFIQTIYITPSFIIFLCILCQKSCDPNSLSTQLLVLEIFIHLMFYMLVIQYLSLKYLTRKIITIYHDYFISFTLLQELLLFIMLILHLFYVDGVNSHRSDKLNIKSAIFYILSVPLIFPLIYYRYYYQKLDPNKLSILYGINYRFKYAQYMIERVYSFIHIMCHDANSYHIIIDCNITQSKADHDTESKAAPLILDNDRQSVHTPNGKIIPHKDDTFLCLQYQYNFMRLDFDDKIKYICQIAPYRSKFFASKHSIKCENCKNKNICLTYFFLILKFLGNISPLWWFSFVYLYECNGDDIKKYGADQWLLFYDENKYQHIVIATLFSIYFFITTCWIYCAFEIFSKEYYYGFIRSLLINIDDENISDKVGKFHDWMLKNNQIITVLEQEGIITHLAIQIVSYLPYK